MTGSQRIAGVRAGGEEGIFGNATATSIKEWDAAVPVHPTACHLTRPDSTALQRLFYSCHTSIACRSAPRGIIQIAEPHLSCDPDVHKPLSNQPRGIKTATYLTLY